MNNYLIVEKLFKGCESLVENLVISFKQSVFAKYNFEHILLKSVVYKPFFNQTLRAKYTGLKSIITSVEYVFFHNFHMPYYYDYYNLIWKGARI